MELMEDPLVLVDEWCVNTEERRSYDVKKEPGEISASSVACLSSHGLRKRAHEELTWLRSSVQQLHDLVAANRLCPHPRVATATSDDEVHTSGEDSESDAVAPAQHRVKARRLLHAVHVYNCVRDAMRLSFGYAGSETVLPVDDERMLATLRSRLDALARIAQTNRMTGKPKTLVDSRPTLTGSGFRAQARAKYVLPFKLSLVADVSWEMLVEGLDDGQLSVSRPNELFTRLESSYETPWGVIATTTLIAYRRMYQDDGSVLHVHTSVASGTHDSRNLLAGCVSKQAGWSWMERAPQYDGVRAGRLLVSVEIAQSIVVEALPGHILSRDRLLRFWDAIQSPSNQQGHGRTAFENRLLDRQVTSK